MRRIHYIASMILFIMVTLPTWVAKGEDFSGHYGVDINSPVGSRVLATDSGIVVSVTPYKRGENQITIKTGGGAECIYVYVKPLVAEGQVVMAGDVIGISDDSAPTVRGIFHYAYRSEPSGFFIDPREHLPQRTLE